MKFRIVIFALVFALAGCNTQQRESVRNFLGDTVSQVELKYMIDNQLDVVIVDLRTRHLYEQNHIPGAVNIPETDLARINDSDYFSHPIVIYASEEAVQKVAYKKLINMGYKNVHMLQGGFFGWTYGYVSD